MWWQVLFWVLLVPCLVVLGIIYGSGRKLYKLFQVLATFTYIILIAYIIDVFDLGRGWILALLLFSALLMLLLGYRISAGKKGRSAGTGKGTPQKSLLWLLSIVAVMILLTVLGALNTGFSRTVQASNLSRAELLSSSHPNQPVGVQPATVLATLDYTNSFFIPHVIPDKYVVACWYNRSTEETGPQIFVSVDGKEWVGRNEPFKEVMPGDTVVRVVRLESVIKEPIPPRELKNLNLTSGGRDSGGGREELAGLYTPYDAILLAGAPDRFDCTSLNPKKLTLYQVITFSD